jgi:S1-C subfamily serine protease
VTVLDLGALVVIAVTAFSGFRRGLVVGACSLGGLAAGAYGGARAAPHVLPGNTSVYPPLVVLAGAVVGAGIGQMLAVTAGRSLRGLFRLGFLRAFDNVMGGMLGAVTGVAVVWFLGAILLYAPGDASLRRAVQRSHIAGTLTTDFPPSRLMDLLSRIDPFQALAGPQANVPPGDPRLLRDPQVRTASRSVLRIRGHACGLGIEGSGWIAAPGFVVTNAHVVAGIRHPVVDRHGAVTWPGTVVAFDPGEDLAVIHVPGLPGRPLADAAPAASTPVVVLGYPEDRPLHAVSGRLGRTVATFVRDAYGRFPVARGVTPIRAEIRPGNSGGPAVDGDGRVRTVVFARRAGREGGFGIPVQLVAGLMQQARRREAVASACAE